MSFGEVVIIPIFKVFNMKIVNDAEGESVYTSIGKIVIPIFECYGTFRRGDVDARNESYHIFDQYIDSPKWIGMAMDSNYAMTHIDSTWYTMYLRVLAPMVINKYIYYYSGKYLKLISENGFYAISDFTISSNGHISLPGWKLYDNQNNYWGLVSSYGFPFINNIAFSCLGASSISNKVLSGNLYSVGVGTTAQTGKPYLFYANITQVTQSGSQLSIQREIDWWNEIPNHDLTAKVPIDIFWHRPNDQKELTTELYFDVKVPDSEFQTENNE